MAPAPKGCGLQPLQYLQFLWVWSVECYFCSSTSLITREIQIKTTKRYYVHHSAGKNEKVCQYQVLERAWINSSSYTSLVGAKLLQMYWETTRHYHVNLNIRIPRPSNSLPSSLPRRNLHMRTGRHGQECLRRRSSKRRKRLLASPMEQHIAVKMNEPQDVIPKYPGSHSRGRHKS